MSYKLSKITHKILVFLLIVLLAMPTYLFSVSATDDSGVDVSSEIVIHRKHENSEMKIALTFDDGPHPRYTPKILAILEKYNIKATFFSVGINAYYYPDTLRMVVGAGHELGNHTYTHPKVSKIEKGRLRQEIEDCEEMLYSITECRTKLFRPPEGMIDRDILATIHDLDYSLILWDVDTRDWAHTPAEKIAENVIGNVSSGDIILMHDYIGVNSPTCDALELFIPVLLEKGYKFVVVSELIGTK